MSAFEYLIVKVRKIHGLTGEMMRRIGTIDNLPGGHEEMTTRFAASTRQHSKRWRKGRRFQIAIKGPVRAPRVFSHGKRMLVSAARTEETVVRAIGSLDDAKFHNTSLSS